MAEPGGTDRALLEGAGAELFDLVLGERGLPAHDKRIVEDGDYREAFDLLVNLGLLHYDTDSERWIAQDPSGIQARVVSPLSSEGTRLLEESTQWARALAGLAQTWRKAPHEGEGGPFTYLRGPAIAAFINGLIAECEKEFLTAQPQSGRDTQALDSMATQERELCERGVRVLTLYQHSARRNIATRDYVSTVSKYGAEVRTLDEFFNRMIVVDRRVAIIPTPDSLAVALAVHEPTIVAYLVDVFMRSWEKARPFTDSTEGHAKQIAGEQRSMTLRMLIEGHSDPAAAKRLGVSPRTYAGYISELKDEFEVETRFQLGFELGKQGLSGDD